MLSFLNVFGFPTVYTFGTIISSSDIFVPEPNSINVVLSDSTPVTKRLDVRRYFNKNGTVSLCEESDISFLYIFSLSIGTKSCAR